MAVSADAMQALQAAHGEVTVEIETVSVKLNDAEAQLADASSQLQKNDNFIDELTQAREAAQHALQTAKEEHQLASKKQQQHAADLKKMIKSAKAADSVDTASSSSRSNTPSAAYVGSPGGEPFCGNEGRLRYPESVEVNCCSGHTLYKHANWV